MSDAKDDPSVDPASVDPATFEKAFRLTRKCQGMADFKLWLHAYECRWHAEVTFVPDGRYAGVADTATEALEELIYAIERVSPNDEKPESATPRHSISVASMTPVEAAAQRTLNLMPTPDPNGPPKDIILAITIVMLIIKLLVIAYTCWKDRDHNAKIVFNPSWMQRLKLHILVKRVLAAHGQADKTAAVVDALLKMAAASSVEDIEAIFAEARSDPKIWTSAYELGLL